MTPLLRLRKLYVAYGSTKVLHGIDLTVRAGSVTALLGSNGAGKTTTLRAVCGLVPAQGEIEFDGKRIDKIATEHIARLGVAHVPEGRGTFLNLTTEENLRLGAYVRRDKAALTYDLDRIYNYFPRLKERRLQQAGTLSGGEQQMLAISRALMLRPRLLLLDEPSFGLAPIIVQEIFAIMQTINQKENVAILLVEQNAAMALALSEDAYLLETGRIILSGKAEAFKQNESVRRSYLGS